MLALRTLGGLSITNAGQVVNLGSLKTALCLAYLRHNAERRVPRAELLDLLWADDSPRSRHSLSQSLYALRRSFRDRILVASADYVILESDKFFYDVEDLKRAVRGGLLVVAADTYRGQFLEGLKAYPTPHVQQWREQVARQTATLAAAAFRSLCRQAEVGGNWQEVDLWAARLLEIDDLDEEAHAQRIRATAAQMGMEAACRLAKDVRAQFSAELGGLTSQDLSRTCDKYADADAVGVELLPSQDTPIRGRTEEFRVMSTRWARADAGTSQLIVLSGPAGIGKTRLSTHFLRWAAIRGSRILTVKASQSDTHLPYAILVQLLRSGVRKVDVHRLDEPWRRWVATLLPEYGETEPAEGHSHPGQRELFESVARLLLSMCENAPLTIFVDDFDQCDQSSAWVIGFVFKRFLNERLTLVCASRKPAAAFPEHARLLLVGLNTAQFTSLRLDPLDYPSAVQIARDRLERINVELPSGEFEEIIEYAKGVPFFLLEAIDTIGRDAIVRNIIYNDPSGGYGVLAAIRLLPKDARAVLIALAVLGYRAPRTVTRATSELSIAEFSQAVSHLVSKRLIRLSGQYIEFNHDLVREAALADMSEAEGRWLNKRAASAISSVASSSAGRLAIHYTAADIPDRAYEAAMAAAREATRLSAPDDAEFYLRLAVSKAPTPLDRSRARAALAEHFCVLEVFHEAQCVLTSSPEVWPHLQTETANLIRVYNMLTDAACPAATFLEHLETIWPSGEDVLNDGARARLLRTIIGLSYQIGSPLARTITFSLVEKSGALERTPDTAKLLACLARSWAVIEGGSKGLELANRAVSMAIQIDDKSSIAFSLLSRATVRMLLGDLIHADVDYAACHDMVQAPAFLALAVRRIVNRSVLLIETGRPEEASKSLEGTLPYHAPLEQIFLRGNMALAALEMQDVDSLLRRISELRSINSGTGLMWVEHFANCMEAYFFARSTKLDESSRIIAQLAESERRTGTDVLGPDPSYAQVLIGEWLARISPARGLEYLEESADRCAGKNALGEIRVRLMHARVLLDVNEASGRQELRELIHRCRSGGALTLLEHCERLAKSAGL